MQKILTLLRDIRTASKKINKIVKISPAFKGLAKRIDEAIEQLESHRGWTDRDVMALAKMNKIKLSPKEAIAIEVELKRDYEEPVMIQWNDVLRYIEKITGRKRGKKK